MPETASEKLRCERRRSGHQHKAQQQSDKTEQLEWSCPPSQARQSQVSPSPPRSKGWNNVEGRRQVPLDPTPSLQYQHRPSVLRQGGGPAIHRQQLGNGSSQPVSPCKVERSAGQRSQSSPPHPGPAPRHTLYSSPPRTGSPKQSSGKTRPQDCNLRAGNALFVSGLCRWPGCDAALGDFPSFLKHLYSDHGHSDKSIAQWKVQQDMVQYMESQLTQEKQKLFAMQLHLQLSEHKFTEVNLASDWPYSMALFLPQPQAADGGRVPRCATKDADELAQRAYYWHAGTAHLLPDLVPSIECYKYNNIRPPYTYACLIRWSILESPDKQRTLNEIYTWFTTMFFYFRHNTATWKNAVRHNLSLHKCFVRVEGGKGAVWTVDETEYQRRKGQKYYRDHPAKWLGPYPNINPEEP